MSRPCVPAACSPPMVHMAGDCDTCGGETVEQICCLKVTRSSWLHPAILKRVGYTIGDPCVAAGANEYCGELFSTWGSACIEQVSVEWHVMPDCSVRMSISYAGTSFAPPIIVNCNPPANWHTAPYTVTAPGGDTITVEVCSGSETIFPSADASGVALRAALWYLVDGVWTSTLPGAEFPPFKTYAASTGTSMCVLNACAALDPEDAVAFLVWGYDITADTVIVQVFQGGIEYGRIEVPWDSAGAWADGLTVIPWVPIIPAGEPWTDMEWRVARIEDCDDTTDPGAECESGCYPSCLKCPDIATLALHIEEDPTCCLNGTFDLHYNSGDDWWQSWPPAAPGDPPTVPGLADRIGGPDGVCGIILWFKVSCGTDGTHVNIQFRYRDVKGSEFTANYDAACTCTPSFETEYLTIPSNPFAPGLCDGAFFRGSKLRVVAV